MESRITFHSGALQLEGQINPHSRSQGVVVTHPHPLYGGDLSSPVVESIAMAYANKGFTTLRFNFRGVGESEGEYDGGLGEQDDVLAAIELLRASGIRQIHLAGYSFGTWVNARIPALPPEVTAQIMVAPPVALLDFAQVAPQPMLTAIMTGSDDEYAPPELIRKYLPRWNPKASFTVIEDADHFFFGRFRQLEEALAAAIPL
jgi:alpha/beta superfamily hydrolase